MENYKIKLDVFEGPMDLLLHLIDKHKIDIYDIPIAILTKQYLRYLDEMKSFNIEISSEFLVMAATLLQIKSKMLLPRQNLEEDEEEDPRSELVNRIIEYRRFKEVSEVLSNMIEVNEQFCAREPTAIPTEYLPPQNIPLDVLIAAFNTVLQIKEDIAIPEVIVTKEEFNIEDKMQEVLNILKKFGGEILFLEAFYETSKVELIFTFLAILELIRNNKIYVNQKHNFSEIFIFLKEGNALDERLFSDT